MTSRATNDAARGRRHLLPDEIEKVCAAIRKDSRNADRDELLILMAFTHGLRVSELINIKWQHINFQVSQIAITRAKGGIDSTHPLSSKRELMLLRRLFKHAGKPTTGHIFLSERGSPVSISTVQKMVRKFSELALGVIWNAHALRHACGTALIEQGHNLRTVQVYIGHSNIQNTTLYTHESVRQFSKIEF